MEQLLCRTKFHMSMPCPSAKRTFFFSLLAAKSIRADKAAISAMSLTSGNQLSLEDHNHIHFIYQWNRIKCAAATGNLLHKCVCRLDFQGIYLYLLETGSWMQTADHKNLLLSQIASRPWKSLNPKGRGLPTSGRSNKLKSHLYRLCHTYPDYTPE